MNVAIAYQDDWYPGIVVELVNEQKAYVKLMTPCQTMVFPDSLKGWISMKIPRFSDFKLP